MKRRLSHRERVLRKKAQKRDALYLTFSIIIFFALYSSVFAPIAGHLLKTVKADTKIVSPTPTTTPTPVNVHFKDKRINTLYSFLKAKGSPLADYAGYMVSQSDENGLDWTLLAAIAGKESGYCTTNPASSFNCWGIGGSSFMYFANYEEAIAYEATLLGTNYRYNEISGIQAKYCPFSDGCASNWAQDVTNFSREVLANE